MAEDKKLNIFQKTMQLTDALIDNQIAKARTSISEAQKDKSEQFDVSWGKAVTRDRSYYIGSQGFQEKAGALTYEYQRQMAIKSSIISAIIRTKQNKVAAFSEYVPEGNKLGFTIRLKHEHDMLMKIKEELFGEEADPNNEILSQIDEEAETESLGKAFEGSEEQPIDVESLGEAAPIPEQPEEEAEPLTDADRTRVAKSELEKRTRAKKLKIVNFLKNCGEAEDRPFDSKKWNFDAYLRAIVWDSMVYDQIATELVPKEANILEGKLNLHHFYPVDGASIRYASPELAKYKDTDLAVSQDILYPEEELKGLEERDALVLDDTRLANHEYKYVQLIRGRIARAFTEDELKVGMRNPTSDIYTNGYSISELEMLVALVTSHLQTEFYNRSYFQQGFSAKGILHIKANLNRSKLEELRRNWNHMVKGNRNSFQTPIMAGMDAVEWIPLTQSHSEMEFTMWLNYLIRMICAIYQIDPAEVGYALKDAGGGGGISGDNTKEKLGQSKDKGFIPLMKFFQDYINRSIIDVLDDDYELVWCQLEEESNMARLARLKDEVAWFKTVNEVRSESGLPPIHGADNLILNPVYFQWLSTMSEDGQKLQEKAQEQMLNTDGSNGGNEEKPSLEAGGENFAGDQRKWQADEASAENSHSRTMEAKATDHSNKMTQLKASKANVKKALAKSIRIEYYKVN